MQQSLSTALAESIDTGMVAVMRCLLAAFALAVVYLDPTQALRPDLTYAGLLIYTTYSVALCASDLRRWIPQRAQPWIDVVFYSYLVALTQGTGSIFFHFFFFAIVTAAFSRGLREGLAVTMVAVLSFAGISLVEHAGSHHLRLSETLTRTVSLYLLGYLVSYWGGHEIALRT